MLPQDLYEILTNPLISLILGIIFSGIVSVIITKRYLSRKKLAFVINGFKIIDKKGFNRFDHLSFAFKGISVERVIFSKVAFWNNGNLTILGEDIIQKNRLRIVPKEGVSILDYTLAYASNDYNDFKVEPHYTEDGDKIAYLEVSFDYIDRKQGVVIQLYHTGEDISSISFLGSIKGIETIAETIEREPLSYMIGLYGKRVLIFTGFLIIVYTLFDLLGAYFITSREVSLEKSVLTAFSTGIGTFLTVITMSVYVNSKKPRIPKDIQKHLTLLSRQKEIKKTPM